MADEKKTDQYDATISETMQESLEKAIEIFNNNLNNSNRTEIKRPDVSLKKGVIHFLIFLVILILLIFAYFKIPIYHNIPDWIFVIFIISIFSFLPLIKIKKILTWVILIYQKYAPEHIRKSCLFTPCCSDYTIMAINKYGSLKGLVKSIKRIKKCKHPNGGADYP